MNDLNPGRRRLLKMFGLSATATTAAVLQADPVLAATPGYDEKTGVSPASYQPPPVSPGAPRRRGRRCAGSTPMRAR